MVDIHLTPAARSRLKTCITLSGVERIEQVPELNAVLSQKNEDDVHIPDHLLETARSLATLGLKQELDHIGGLCSSGRLSEANQRIAAPYGLQGLVDVIASLTVDETSLQD